MLVATRRSIAADGGQDAIASKLEVHVLLKLLRSGVEGCRN